MVRPVSIQHADLCYSWISVFFSCIILLYIWKSLNVIARFKVSYNAFNSSSEAFAKPSKLLISSGTSNSVTRVFGFFFCLTAVYRVDTEMTDSVLLCQSQRCGDHIGGCCADHRLLIFFLKLYTALESALWSNCPGRCSTENQISRILWKFFLLRLHLQGWL